MRLQVIDDNIILTTETPIENDVLLPHVGKPFSLLFQRGLNSNSPMLYSLLCEIKLDDLDDEEDREEIH